MAGHDENVVVRREVRLEPDDGAEVQVVSCHERQRQPSSTRQRTEDSLGSSSNSKCGLMNSARARATRIRHPPDMSFVGFFIISCLQYRLDHSAPPQRTRNALEAETIQDAARARLERGRVELLELGVHRLDPVQVVLVVAERSTSITMSP